MALHKWSLEGSTTDVRKFNSENERIKHRYFAFLSQAKQLSAGTVDQVAAALSDFEKSTNCRDFRLFRPEQAQRYKRQLQEAINPSTNRPLAKATICSRLGALKAFVQWLSQERGFRSRIAFTDAEYFNLSANDERAAKTVRERPAPTVEQIRQVLHSMPVGSDIDKRNQALIAFALLSGARDDAIASMSMKHVDINQRHIFQDAREVRTKNAKTINTTFFPVGDDIEAIFVAWFQHLRVDLGFGLDDPLFPATKTDIGPSGHYENVGLDRKHWQGTGTIRKIFRQEFERAGLPYFNPHLFRKTLAVLGLRTCKGNLEAMKAWSQNFGHSDMLTTLTSYGTLSASRQAEILNGLRHNKEEQSTGLDDDTVQKVVTLLRKGAANIA